MLGGCSLSYGDRTVDGVNYHTKKPWVLLAYLIAFRSREIPVEELMDLLYPGEGGANPSGALKTLVYRVRTMLEELGPRVPEDVQLIGFDGTRRFAGEGFYCSTIVQPITRLAETSVDLLLQEDRSSLPSLVCLPVQYAPGGTTRE